ncbi:MAG: N-acetyltransferase family protein [Burkholderiaceae bacterium]
MEIRTVSETDRDQWLPLWHCYQKFYKTTIDESVTATTWQRFLNPSEPVHCAVAEDGQQLIGIVHFIFHRSCWTEGDYVYLQDLFVDPNIRGKGVGRALIEHVVARAREADASRVWWLTHESNSEAMLLYDRIAEKSGFVQYRTLL